MGSRVFVLSFVLFLVAFRFYADYQEQQHALNAYAIKCRDFGGQVERVPAYTKPLCSKGGGLFSLD